MAKDRKKIVKSKFRKGLIPEDLLDEINNDIEQYLEKKSKTNEKRIQEMIKKRLDLGLTINFSETYIKEKVSMIYT
ncbi:MULTISPECIES: hypothetical protein [Aquimarina]|uniref:hypothetical protein n=1 Tax=Aquimarina TaxID=290174 RepID=UPI000420EA4D|nr:MULTISPECIES: hypothetical protein [Aquimarina]